MKVKVMMRDSQGKEVDEWKEVEKVVPFSQLVVHESLVHVALHFWLAPAQTITAIATGRRTRCSGQGTKVSGATGMRRSWFLLHKPSPAAFKLLPRVASWQGFVIVIQAPIGNGLGCL